MTMKRLSNQSLDDDENAEFVEIDGESEDITELQNDIDSQINRIFEEFGGDPQDTEFNIYVKRVMPGRGELEHCFSCLPHELPITDRIQNEWGPGEYSIWIYMNKKIWKRRKMNIAKPMPKLPPPNPLSGDISDILSAMQASQERQWEQMRQMMTQQQQQPSQMDQMSSMLNMMVMMKQVMGESKPHDPMKTIELAKSLAEMMGDMGDKSSLDRLIEGALPALLEGAKLSSVSQTPQIQIKPNPVSMSVPIPKTPQSVIKPTIQQSIHSSVDHEENPEMFIKGVVKSRLPQLITWARQDKDPGFYAEFVLDNIPDLFLDRYCDFVQQENAISKLIEIDSGVGDFKEWFESFRNVTIELIKEMDGQIADDRPQDFLSESSESLTNSLDVDQNKRHVLEQSKSNDAIEGETAPE